MSKLKSLNFLIKFSKEKRKSGKKIVLCHGVFDFPHLGHIKHFKAAKKFGDYFLKSKFWKEMDKIVDTYGF